MACHVRERREHRLRRRRERRRLRRAMTFREQQSDQRHERDEAANSKHDVERPPEHDEILLADLKVCPTTYTRTPIAPYHPSHERVLPLSGERARSAIGRR